MTPHNRIIRSSHGRQTRADIIRIHHRKEKTSPSGTLEQRAAVQRLNLATMTMRAHVHRRRSSEENSKRYELRPIDQPISPSTIRRACTHRLLIDTLSKIPDPPPNTVAEKYDQVWIPVNPMCTHAHVRACMCVSDRWLSLTRGERTSRFLEIPKGRWIAVTREQMNSKHPESEREEYERLCACA